MNKGLLKIALLSMVCASMPAAITSCKDYDDDINTLGQKDNDLASQISAIDAKVNELKNAAEEARNNAAKALEDAAAAKAAGDAAAAAAAEAKHEAELAKQAAATAKAEALEEIKAELAKYTTLEETAKLQARVKALEEALAKLTPGTGGTSYDEAIQALQTQLDALNIYKDLLANLAGKEELLNGLQQTITEINAAIAGLKNQTSGFDATLKSISDRVAALEGNLVTINGDELRALVFNPVFYYHGIEAMWAKTWAYQPLVVNAVNADGDFKEDGLKYAEGDSVFMTPDLIAEYHMNPSTADMPKDVEAYSFTNTIKHVDFVRSAGVPAPTIDSIGFENGIVEVRANLKNGILPYIAKDSKVTVLALQVNLGDTVITSDYAALKPLYSYGFKLAHTGKKDTNAHQVHLYTTMEEAIANNPQYDVPWNSEGVNIAEWVNTHYWTDESRKIATNPCVIWDTNASKETVRRDGFDYEYALVGYTLGQNKTSESAHAALKEEGDNCYFRPQMTDKGKQQNYGYEQNMASVDRLPIVRVALKDTVSGKYAAVGYIKVRITPDKIEDKVTVIAPFVDETGYTATCPLQHYDKPLDWWKVEEQILQEISKLGISKQEFETEYKPDFADDPKTLLPALDASKAYFSTTNTCADTYVLKQFTKDGDSYKVLPVNQWIGKIGKTEYDQAAAETNIFRWIIPGEEAYNIFVDQKKTTVSVTVRFVKTTTVTLGDNWSQDVNHYVYVTMTWTPKPLNVTPAGEIVNEGNKIPEMWYTAWSADPGFDETHLNVNVPRDESRDPNECVYQSFLLYPWVNEMVTVSNVNSIYTGYQDQYLDKSFTFDQKVAQQTAVGVSGAKYTLTAPDGLTLYAALTTSPTVMQPVAVISNDTIPAAVKNVSAWRKPVITYQETPYAKDILSAYDGHNLKQDSTLAARIVIKAQNQCDKPIALTNNTFNTRFLRPVNMIIDGKPEMIDATNDGSKLDLGDFLRFTDWRFPNAMSEFSTHRNYYWYYGLESISVGYVNPADPGKIVGYNPNEPAVTSGSLRGVITTTLAGGTLGGRTLGADGTPGGKRLSEITPNIDVVYTPATGHLDNYNLGTLTYYNHRDVINTEFMIRVPLVLKYKWGYLTGILDITVKPTRGNPEL